MIERLPTPWGLVRLGVAPDHPKIKAVSRAFEKIAAQPGFRFLGNVEVGRDLTHEELAPPLRRGRLRGRRADRPAHGHPRRGPARARGPPPSSSPGTTATPTSRTSRSTSRASARSWSGPATSRSTSCGCSRLRRRRSRRPTRPTRRSRRSSAPASEGDRHARPAAARRRRRSRRPELKELGELAGADVIVDPADLELDPASEASLERDTNARRNLEVLREYAARAPAGQADAAIRLRFRVSPVAILGEDRVEAIELVRNRARRRRGAAASRAEPTGRARDDPVRDRLPQRRLPRRRAARACRSTSAARRSRTSAAASDAAASYCAGWIKRGPSGVIGTNKKDATETVDAAARGRARRAAARGDATRPRRPSTQLLAERGVEAVDLRGLGGDRPRRSGARRAARPAARQAPHAGTSCCAAARAESTSAQDARRPEPPFRALTLSRDGSRRRKPILSAWRFASARWSASTVATAAPSARTSAAPLSTSARSATTSAGPRARSSPSARAASCASGRSSRRQRLRDLRARCS